MSRDPAIICIELREIGLQQPTDDSFTFVVNSLHSKWQSVQVVAAQVLGSWGLETAVPPLRAWLEALFVNRRWFSVRKQAFKALAKCVTEADVSWILDLYFQQEGMYLRVEMLDFMRVVLSICPTAEASQRLVQDCRSNHLENSRASIMIYGTVPFPNRLQQLQMMWDDPQQLNKNYIETYLSWRAYDQEGYQYFLKDWRGK